MSKNPTRHRYSTVVCVIALALAASACSTKSSTDDARDVEGIKVGPGISGKTITLGSIVDLSGPFAPLGNPALEGVKVVVDQINATGGICGKFEVKLDVQDSASDVQKATQQYESLSDHVLSLVLTTGAPVNTALTPSLTADKVVNVPLAWGRSVLKWEGNAIPGGLYDVDIANGIDYLLDKGELEKGDTIGHIHFVGEYGENGLAGSKHVAEKRGLKVIAAEIAPTDADMTAQVSKFAKEGVSAIALSVAPGQTASTASAAAAQGLDVPIVANYPSFAAGILDSPAGPMLARQLYVSGGFGTWYTKDAADLEKAWKKANPNGKASTTISSGSGVGKVMQAILEKACKDGDLTREGVLAAKKSLTNVQTDGLLVPLDFSTDGSPTLSSNILRPTDAPGRVKIVEAAYTGPDLDGL